MVAVKAHQALSFLEKPNPKIGSYLFFGTDPGLVSERSKQLAEKLANATSPASEILRLDEKDLDAEPDRIGMEMQTLAMFGGGKVVRVKHGRRVTANALKLLLSDPNPACHLIIEAANLRPGDSLRTLFEKSTAAAAVACYADSARDLEALINRKLAESQQTITMDGRELLVARLGADRALSVGELDKLTLYTSGQRQITADDVEAIVGDASEMALDKIVYAAALGQAKTAVGECARALSAGDSVHAILAAAQRHFHRLQTARAHLDSGKNEADALKRLKPPLHFKQKSAFVSQLYAWRHDALLDAIDTIVQASRATRSNSALDAVLVERLLIRVAQLAQRSKRAAIRPG